MPLPQDRLTNLINESELESQMEYELQRCRRYAWDLTFIMAEPVLPGGIGQDLAYPALRRLSLTAAGLMRSVDKGIRCGSALIYILPETPAEGGDVALAKLRAEFAKAGVTNPLTGESVACGVRVARYTFTASAEEARQSEVPGWKEILVALRGDLQEEGELEFSDETQPATHPE